MKLEDGEGVDEGCGGEGWDGWVALFTGGGCDSGFLGAPSGSPRFSLVGVLDVVALGLPVGGVPLVFADPSGSDCCRRSLLRSSSRPLPVSSTRLEEGVRKRISLRTLPSPPMTVRVMWTVPPSPDW